MKIFNTYPFIDSYILNKLFDISDYRMTYYFIEKEGKVLLVLGRGLKQIHAVVCYPKTRMISEVKELKIQQKKDGTYYVLADRTSFNLKEGQQYTFTNRLTIEIQGKVHKIQKQVKQIEYEIYDLQKAKKITLKIQKDIKEKQDNLNFLNAKLLNIHRLLKSND